MVELLTTDIEGETLLDDPDGMEFIEGDRKVVTPADPFGRGASCVRRAEKDGDLGRAALPVTTIFSFPSWFRRRRKLKKDQISREAQSSWIVDRSLLEGILSTS